MNLPFTPPHVVINHLIHLNHLIKHKSTDQQSLLVLSVELNKRYSEENGNW